MLLFGCGWGLVAVSETVECDVGDYVFLIGVVGFGVKICLL
jgi:hypothetical protein